VDRLAGVLTWIADSFQSDKKWDDALDYYNRLRQIYEKQQLLMEEGLLRHKIAMIYREKGDESNTKAQLQKSDELLGEFLLKDQLPVYPAIDKGRLLIEIAQISLELGNKQKSLDFMTKAKEFYDSINPIYYQGTIDDSTRALIRLSIGLLSESTTIRK
jgi:tetratricopeptide (TPR) repeat protein